MAACASTATQVAGDVEAGTELSQMFERLTELPMPLLVIVLRPLPSIELARIARIHKSFWRVLLTLREQLVSGGITIKRLHLHHRRRRWHPANHACLTISTGCTVRFASDNSGGHNA